LFYVPKEGRPYLQRRGNLKFIYNSGDQIKQNEKGRVRGPKWRGEVYTWFGWGYLRESDHLVDLREDRRIILIFMFRM
jgi:hypothetical protein